MVVLRDRLSGMHRTTAIELPALTTIVCDHLCLWGMKLIDSTECVCSDYLTPYDGEQKMLQSRGSPVVVYTYRLSFTRTAQNNTQIA